MAAAYAAYRQRLGGARLPPMDADYRSEIDNYPTWVVEVEGRILGGLIMTFGGNQASIANIAVDPEFQGQGIGGELMRFAESKARDSHASELSLATHVLLDENISLYRHLGWEESGRDASRVFMKKSL
jgi:GNAT superfamily N-acetyltransferase